MSTYRFLLRPALFKLDAERAHNLTIAFCEAVARLPGWPLLAGLARRRRPDPLLKTTLAGMALDSPIGLGAGFDKNGRALDVLSNLGFGSIEIGAVSMQPCAGNAGCRAIRLPAENAVLTRYGVPNDGVDKVVPRFARHVRKIPVGVNVIWNSTGKPDSSIHEVVADMASAVAAFEGLTDYVTINFACPNIKGESHFNDIDNVRLLFEAVDARAPRVPVFLKFRHRADLAWIDAMVELTLRYRWVKGFIPIAHVMRPMGAGGPDGSPQVKGSLSGAPLKAETIDIIRQWYSRIDPDRLSLVATGGISSAQDVFDAMSAGASMAQIFTTMIFEGPGIVDKMNDELAALMRQARIASTQALTGSSAPARPKPVLESMA